MLVEINTIKWERKGVIRELCIMAVRLAPKSGLGCECLSWRRMFWERSNFCLKSWGTRMEAELYQLLTRLPVAGVARSPMLTQAIVPNDRVKVRSFAEWVAQLLPRQSGSSLNHVCTWQFIAINIHWVSPECVVLAGLLGEGADERMWELNTPVGTTYLPRGAVERVEMERENWECRLWEMLR